MLHTSVGYIMNGTYYTCTGKHALENMHCEGPMDQLVKAIQTHVSQPPLLLLFNLYVTHTQSVCLLLV